MIVPVVASERHRGHDPDVEVWHGEAVPAYEFPRRADLIRAALEADGGFAFCEPDGFGTGPIDAVHEPGLNRFLETAWREAQATNPSRSLFPDTVLHASLRDGMPPAPEPTESLGRLGYWCFETMTPVLEGTYDAARAAVDVALSAGQLVLSGAPIAYGLCRPPGHHAARAVFGGYCFFNNAAIVANALVDQTAGRVAVLDVDYHHGNGTQQIFYRRADVLYASLHGDPARTYPYFAGHRDETGAGPGLGSTYNLPLPAGCDDELFLASLRQALDVVDRFAPEVVVVSLGVDTFSGDPLGDLDVSTEALEACGRIVADAGRPLVVLQEGGYAVEELGENVRRWLRGAAG